MPPPTTPNHPRPRERRVWAALLLWAAAVCTLLGILDPLGGLIGLATVAAAVGGAVLVAYAASHWRSVRGSSVRFALLFAAIGMTLGGGRLVGRWGCFLLARPAMEREIQHLRADALATQPADRVRFEREQGGLRAAFVRSGLLDHWCGWVYDEQGTLAASLDAHGRVLGPAADWFGGRMVRAERLTGPWWCCWFN